MTFKYRYRYQIIIISIIIILILGIVFSYFYIFKDNKKETKSEKLLSLSKETKKIKKVKKVEEIKKIMVDIKGEVNNPGIYSLDTNSRVIDAINLAGGITKNGDTSVLNLSKKLSDEMVIIVYSYYEVSNFSYTKEKEEQVNKSCSSGVNEIENDACITETEDEKESSNTDTKISINTATKEELMTLTGIGEAKALNIIKYREEHGLFQSIDDIKNVDGIGDSLFAKIKENITV